MSKRAFNKIKAGLEDIAKGDYRIRPFGLEAPRLRSKYGAVPTTVDGITFHSKGEASRYQQLKLMERAGLIRNLELQPKYEIVIKNKHVCWVILDFRYFEGQTRTVEDFKGKDTAVSRLKRKLVEAAYPGTEIKVVK